ncbi:UPF0158 family protein [Litchfieldia alkalitelluris]|uniref:UPF0158 family protein n=1 Tax=Litchfieldia alkalitelluris TaxID=304268 RepID=UPI0009971D25|nr:UPF0158 family protein [Litchfieldia alkalitelluris]
MKIKLEKIVDELEMQFDESHSFLNLKTGEVVGVTSGDLRAAEDEEPYEHLPEWQQENRVVANDIIENFEDYVELPTEEDINDYDIMEDFCLTVVDDTRQEALFVAIRGRGAFRRFKDLIIDFNIEDQWYLFRAERLKEIAIQWCEDNDIAYE